MLEPANPANPYTVLVSTRNAHKLVEIRQILGPSFELLDLSCVPALGEVEETGETFEENASLKALAASAHFGGWVLADDSGLEVDALGGAPGVRSARFSGEGATDASNRALLLEKLTGVPADQRSARFRCMIALARGGEVLAHFSGSVEGTIIASEKGVGGFGYDPLFVPEGFSETFAELSAETKNSLSHRGRALASLKVWPGWVR
jgi:XTP/dITP diphosphohydrolase